MVALIVLILPMLWAPTEAARMHRSKAVPLNKAEEAPYPMPSSALDEHGSTSVRTVSPGTTKYNVYEAASPHRSIIRDYELQAEYSPTWKKFLAFHAFSTQQPGTKMYHSYEGTSPHREIFRNHTLPDKYTANWKKVLTFFAFSTPQPGTKEYRIYRRTNPQREIIRHYELPAEYMVNWKKVLTFYAYEHQPLYL